MNNLKAIWVRFHFKWEEKWDVEMPQMGKLYIFYKLQPMWEKNYVYNKQKLSIKLLILISYKTTHEKNIIKPKVGQSNVWSWDTTQENHHYLWSSFTFRYNIRFFTLAKVLITQWCWSPVLSQSQDVFGEDIYVFSHIFNFFFESEKKMPKECSLCVWRWYKLISNLLELINIHNTWI
jgi:hypothetical protein